MLAGEASVYHIYDTYSAIVESGLGLGSSTPCTLVNKRKPFVLFEFCNS